MSHYRIKVKYNQEGSYGSIDEKTLYAHHNLSCDIVSFYDEEGDCILSVDDTMDNNLLDAINKGYSCFDENGNLDKSEVESMTMEEKQFIAKSYTHRKTPINFARWILKHAESHTTNDGFFCWKYGGKEIDTHELYEIFLKELKGED